MITVFVLKRPPQQNNFKQNSPMPQKTTLNKLNMHKRLIMGVFDAGPKVQRKAYTKQLWRRRFGGLEVECFRWAFLTQTPVALFILLIVD